MARFHRPIKHILVSVLAGAALVACGGGEKEEDPIEVVTEDGEVVERSRADARAAQRREEARQRAADEAEARFSFARYRIDLSGSEPGACFIFSSALKAETDYSPFLEFSDNFRPALTVNGRELCLGGLSFGEERVATLKTGLPAEDGRLLAEDEDVLISFQDRPTYVGFQGSGVILPRLEADGLPLETVNVDMVKVSVSRVDTRALYRKEINQGQSRQQGRYLYLYGSDGALDVAEPVWSGTMAIEAQRNAPVTTVFPLSDVIDRSKPGAYFVKIEDGADLANGEGPPASAARWIMMTDLALTAYRGQHGLDLTLRSLQTGQPIQNANVELVAVNNSILGEAQTGSDGRVSFEQPIMSGDGNLRPRNVIAYGDNGDIAVLDLDRAPVDLASDETGGRTVLGEFDGYTYTDRGIYRPGEPVHLTSLLRDRTGAALGDRPGNIIIYRPNGLEASRHRFTDSRSGGLSWTYDIPRGASRGEWAASVQLDGAGEISTTRFSVEDFVPQRIAVELDETATAPVKVDEARDLNVDARFLYGAPGAGLVVQSRMRVAPDPAPFEGFEGFIFGQHDQSFRERLISLPDQVTDGAGKTTLRLDPRNAGDNSNRPLRLITVVDVLEPGGRAVSESIRIPYRPQDVYLGVKRGFDYRAPEGEPVTFEVAAINADGEAVSEEVSWKLIEIRRHYDWFREAGSGRWRWRRSRTTNIVNEGTLPIAADTTGTIQVNGLEWGNHELHIETSDAVITDRAAPADIEPRAGFDAVA
ncbi:MAG: MG2 domain-containing protein, partial [Pseudomonadota bacterium]